MACLSPADYQQLVDYCRDVDLVVFDSAYSPEDYPKYKGWGHSTVEDGLRLRKDSGCKKMLFSHFSQEYSDEEITSWQQYFDGDYYILARDGMEIEI